MKIQWQNKEQLDKLASPQNTKSTVDALKQALTEEAQLMFRESQRRVPVKTGVLKNSGQILPPTQTGDRIEIEMGYGGAASAYALLQHETQGYRHASGKSWKYLESPVRERIPNLAANLAKRMGRILG